MSAEPLEDAFHAVIRGQAESDNFNRLVMGAGLDWRAITILRAVAKFLRQAAIPFSQDYMEQALNRNPDIAVLLVELFVARNHPADSSEAAAAKIAERIEAALRDVPSLDDDRILRRFRNVIENILRTNFWQQRPRPPWRSNWTPRSWRNCPRPGPGAKSSSMPPPWKACICASARWRAAAFAGPTGARISAPRYWGWSKRSRSRMR